MTDQSNYAIPRLSDWLKNPTPPCSCDFSQAWNKLQVIPRNSDWFIVQFALVVIDHCSDFGIGFLTVI